MKEIIEIIKELRQLSGDEQIEALRKHKHNKKLREVLYYCYCPDLKYKVKEAKFNKIEESISFHESDVRFPQWNDYKLTLDKFASQKGVKDDEILDLIVNIFFHLSSEEHELFKSILFKDLRLGMNISKFNKVWNDFHFKYGYMGARPYNKKNLKFIKYPAIAQTKEDGLFCNAVFANEDIKYISRQGKKIGIDGILDLDVARVRNEYGSDFVLNGEIRILDKNGVFLDRKTSNGLINSGKLTDEQRKRVEYIVWDIIPYQDFVSGVCNIDYKTRFLRLAEITLKTKNISLVDSVIVCSQEEAMDVYYTAREIGEEGIILKNLDQVWKNSKNVGQVKVKAELECDLEMVEFVEGKGAYSGMCGAVKCRASSNDNRELEVSVKPRTPEVAQEIWNNIDLYKNTIVSVKYNEVIQDKNESYKYSLYLPVWVETRVDKCKADTVQEILNMEEV